MTPDRASWLLAHPLETAPRTAADLAPWRTETPQASGAVLVAVLAVDR